MGVPPDLWSLELKSGAKPRRVTNRVPQRYRDENWSIPEIVHFTAHDGAPLRGLLYRPADFDASRRYPVVVFVHGAGSMQNVVDGWTIYSPNFKFHTVLTQRGFVVFEVDYRGSLGYGYDFRVGVHNYMGGKDLDDELAGIDYLKTLDWVEPTRIGIYGGSYGGFMALMAMFRAPDVYACGAALRFVSDWENYYRGNPWYCVERLGTPEENSAAYYRSSPIHFAEDLEGPVLLLHGVRDNNVHFQDAAQLVERFIRLGKDFELMIYPVERHGFTEPSSWIDEYERIEEFFVRHLQSQAGAASHTTDGARD
jgi:dipeptidyl aminopeptidase/acylaminoacyl peptidase